MAKTVGTEVPSPMEDYTPQIYIDLTKSDVGELKGVSVGDQVRVIISGTVKSVTLREDNKSKTGSISLESKDVVIRDAPQKGIETLADDDEDD